MAKHEYIVVIVILLVAGCVSDKDHAQPVDTFSDKADKETQESCPDGLVWWEDYNVCAPRVDNCENPWELPLVGGGCVAIGPRGCPKLWDPDADVDCEAGELMEYDGMACPEGFVLTDDEVACIPFFAEDGVCGEMEIPVLGGGCKKVGPDWYDPEAPYGGLDMPYFDECPDGQLALKGGGCVQVGPRACPKLWDPEADVDCKVGDVLSCPEGWSESEDGMYCDPLYAECPFGERALVGGACERVIPLAEDCPEGPFPPAPDVSTDITYVSSASNCIVDCGSEATPYSSIQGAINAVPDGGFVLVGLGTYDEGLLIDKPVHVMGVCSAGVTITGVVSIPDGQSKIPTAGIAIVGTQAVALSGLKVISPAVGIVITDATDVELSQMEMAGVADTGLFVGEDADVSASSIWIHGTVESGTVTWMKGQGIWVQDGGGVHITESLLESSRGAGAYARHQGTLLQCEDTVIRSTLPISGGSPGTGMIVSKSAQALLSGCLLEMNSHIGIEVLDSGTDLSLVETVIRKTLPDDNGTFGRGLQATKGCSVLSSNTIFEENRDIGFAAAHSGTQINLNATVIRTTQPQTNGGFGWGLQVIDGATLFLNGSLVDRNVQAGLAIFHSGTQLFGAGSLIRETLLDSSGEVGLGLYAVQGCLASITDSLFFANGSVGIVSNDSGTTVQVEDSAIIKTQANTVTGAGAGVVASTGSDVMITGCLVESNRKKGLIAGDENTTLTVTDSVIRETESADNGQEGIGLYAGAGCLVTLERVLIEKNRMLGLSGTDGGTRIELDQSVIRQTAPDDTGTGGTGVQISGGCELSCSGSILEENSGHGLSIGESPSRALLSEVVIRRTFPNAEGNYGGGIQAVNGCEVQASDSLLEDNMDVAIVVGHLGTDLRLTRCLVRDTLPNVDGNYGWGIEVSGGSLVTVEESLLTRNTELGIRVGGIETELSLIDSQVRDTIVGAARGVGIGVMAGDGCKLDISGSILDSNSGVGLIVDSPETEAVLAKSQVNNTNSDADAEGGTGIEVSGGSTMQITSSLFQGNRYAAIATADEGTSVVISASVLRRTLPALNGGFGRGLLASSGAFVLFEGSMINDCRQVGLSIDRQGTEGHIRGALIQNISPDEVARHGEGVVIQDGSSGTVSFSMISNNHTAGIGVLSNLMNAEIPHLEVINSVITHTGITDMVISGVDHSLGDGIVVSNGGELSLVSSIVSHNERAGVYCYSAGGLLAGNLIWDNSSYGLAMAECGEKISFQPVEGSHDQAVNYVFGNAIGITEGFGEQITRQPGEMPVPETPNIANTIHSPL